MSRSTFGWVLAAGVLVGCVGDKSTDPDSGSAEDGGEDEGTGDDGSGDGGTGDDGAGDGGSGDDGSGDDGADTSDTADPGPVDRCAPLPEPEGTVVDVTVDDVGNLRSIVSGAEPGTTIRFAAGTYALNGEYLWVDVPGVSLRGVSGDPAAVVLDGGYTTTQVISVKASDVTIADLTIRRAYTHAVHVNPADGHVTGTVIHDIVVEDPGQQGIKVNQSGTWYADEGTIRCSEIKLTDAGRPQIRDNCYTGGIDAHRTRGWHVHDNHISGFWCDSGLSEHGIHFWQFNADTRIERNTIVNCARGIGVGLVESASSPRVFEGTSCDDVEAFVEDYDAVIVNNSILADDDRLFASASGFDTGIALTSACGATVAHNTVYSTSAPFSSIEWRYEGTQRALVGNNLVSHAMKARPGAVVTEAGNLDSASATDFVDAAGHDLHLAPDSPAIDAGDDLSDDAPHDDIDGDAREDGAPDVGADER